MGEAKRLRVEPISSSDARAIVKKWHYSHKIVQNSSLHLGVFLDGRCEGAMQFGPSLDKRKLLGLVDGTGWNEFLELNRMAFSPRLPRNSESRALAYALRFIRKTYPWIKWVVSFADATQSGDGGIYRATGFVLTAIKKNAQVWGSADGVSRVSRVSQTKGAAIVSRTGVTAMLAGIKHQPKVVDSLSVLSKVSNLGASRGASSMRPWREAGYAPLPGFQIRYVFFLDPSARSRLTCPVLPFSEIERAGARMYLGVGGAGGGTPGLQPGGGGSTPTPTLHPRGGRG